MTVTLKWLDLTSRFLMFYEAAQGVDDEVRWALWKEHYNFIALPPGPERDQRARQMLDACWDRYPEALERIRAGAQLFRPEPQGALDAVCRVLDYKGDLTVGFVLFVGAFGRNAFAAPQNGAPSVFFPVEEDDVSGREIFLPHEFTHAVHNALTGRAMTYDFSVAYLVMMEGLATRVSQLLVPGRPDEAYLALEPGDGWMEQCRTRSGEILAGIRPCLTEADPQSLMRFTLGTGTTGLIREAYWAGWTLVGRLLEQGRTPAELARLSEAQCAALLDEMIAGF